jgi:hypothetical protein
MSRVSADILMYLKPPKHAFLELKHENGIKMA